MEHAKIKYIIASTDGASIGTIWDSNGKDIVVFEKELKIDLNCGFEIHYVEGQNQKLIAEKLWIDVFTEQLQKGINLDTELSSSEEGESEVDIMDALDTHWNYAWNKKLEDIHKESKKMKTVVDFFELCENEKKYVAKFTEDLISRLREE